MTARTRQPLRLTTSELIGCIINVGAGDAAITIPFTFAATANVIVCWGAFPVFVDIDPDTYNLDASRLQLFLERDR
jgi:dTDP-4-amino-4,6-dideoxygalactose transaminase